MSKYDALWKYVGECKESSLCLTYLEIEKILGFSIVHSFLKYKKELVDYGYKVGKISMKQEKVYFEKVE
ncbi:MAG: hypothetical protein KBT48_12320 [Firmicutes bacterium]|nr:hypothetical protein [Bacillota bacterium]